MSQLLLFKLLFSCCFVVDPICSIKKKQIKKTNKKANKIYYL